MAGLRMPSQHRADEVGSNSAISASRPKKDFRSRRSDRERSRQCSVAALGFELVDECFVQTESVSVVVGVTLAGVDPVVEDP